MAKERRKAERWKMEELCYCYVGGVRVDAAAMDVSSSGVFLRTSQSVLPGLEVALVLRNQLAAASRPIFLMGRVMRRQIRPVAGIGVRFERAATPDSPDVLAEFLRRTLRIEPWAIAQRPLEQGGVIQSVYQFELGEGPARAAAPQDSAEDSEDTLRDLPEVEDEPAVAEESGAAEEERAPGPLTQRMRALGAEARCDLDVAVQVGKESHGAKVSSLSAQHLFVTRVFPGVSPGSKVAVKFSLPVRKGRAQILCHCEMVAFGSEFQGPGSGSVFKIVRVSEGRHEGIFGRYVRWLHFNALRKA